MQKAKPTAAAHAVVDTTTNASNQQLLTCWALPTKLFYTGPGYCLDGCKLVNHVT